MPLDCPEWCDGLHGWRMRGGRVLHEKEKVITPFAKVHTHDGDLAVSEHLQVTLVRERAHPESPVEPRPEHIAVWTTDEDGHIGISPDQLAGLAEEFQRTRQTAVGPSLRLSGSWLSGRDSNPSGVKTGQSGDYLLGPV